MTNDTERLPSPREAVLIVVPLLPDGKHLAGFMTDKWFFYGCHSRCGKDYSPDHEQPLMVEVYGTDWREVHPKVFAAYRTARERLVGLLNQGKIDGKGRHCTEEGRREITDYEWKNGYLDVEKGELSHKQGEAAADFRMIISIVLNPDVVRREASKAIAAGGPKAKAKGVRDCGIWLVELRRNTKMRPPPRAALLAAAKPKFGVGPSQFRKAWDWAAGEEPNELWSKGGAPKGNRNAAKASQKTIVPKTILTSKQS